MKVLRAVRGDNCVTCNFCTTYVCPSPDNCIGCGACKLACPNDAVRMVERDVEEFVTIRVEGEKFQVPSNVTVKFALEYIGYEFTKFPEEGKIFSPCEVGGCWSCAVKIDGELRPSCVTPVRDGMEISFEGDHPRRLVHGFMGHTVGGVGTPWWIKGKYYVEAACFACGCNLRCPQCQNWTTTYRGKGYALTPEDTALIMTKLRRRIGVERIAISGGECTLNRNWLIKYVKSLRRLNPDARIHIDTNGTILTEGYIDELVSAGMTDVGIDLKGIKLETFMRITGVEDERLAELYLKTEWRSVKYIVDNYPDVFVGVGIPYNRELITLEEIARIGDELVKIDDTIQVCALDYRPEFRSNIVRPSYDEMRKVWEVLKGTGLKVVICQTEYGHIGPDGKLI